jgi:hypothetical protein
MVVQHSAEVAAAADLPTEPDGLAGAFVHRIGDVVLELLEALSEPRPDSGLAPVPAVAIASLDRARTSLS